MQSIAKSSQAEAAKRLEGFLTRLDVILPYLALAVNAVSLLRTTHPDLSPSRLMETSHMCIEGDGSKFSDDVDTKSNDGSSTDDDGSIDEGTEKDSSSVGSTSRIAKLGLFEYALRICMLQSREERNHWEISDERIRMFFADPRYVSVPVANVHKATRGGDVPKHTPIQKKKSSIRSPIAPTVSGSRQTSRRLSITEMFYELQVDSPGTGKLGKG